MFESKFKWKRFQKVAGVVNIISFLVISELSNGNLRDWKWQEM